MPASPTIEAYLRSPAGLSTSSPTRKGITGQPGIATHGKTGKRKGKNTPERKSSSRKRKKTRTPFVPDNRDLGTVDLLSDSSEDGDLEVLPPPSFAPVDTHGINSKRITLEEEEWLKDAGGDEVMQVGDSTDMARTEVAQTSADTDSTPCGDALEPVVVDDGPEGTANLLAAERRLADPATQDPLDGCKDDATPVQSVAAHAGCESGSDDEVLVIDPGASCPHPNASFDKLIAQKPNSNPESGSMASASTAVTPSNLGASTSNASTSHGLFAPLSRLFSRSSRDVDAVAASDSEPDDKGKGRASSSLLSSLPNAFTALMAGHTETKQWKAAEEADKQKGRRPKGEEKQVPFYKWIDGLEVTVDAFKYGKIDGCKAYFLSHAHSDHYQQLSSSWSHGPIYASLTTINLIKLKLGVQDEWLHPLPLDRTVKVEGIDVTLIDANHCPGSVLFLFEGPHTDPKSPYSRTPNRIFRYLHCGDFRASPQHIVHPCMSIPSPLPARLPASSAMSRSSSSSSSTHSSTAFVDPLVGRIQKRLDAIYLDTTYLSPSYCFPAQELVINACADLVRERIIGGDEDALWRADGRESERKGLKGWLAPREGVKAELKDEEGDGLGDLMEMDALPEEMEDDSQAPALFEAEEEETQEKQEDVLDEDEDEQAWKAAHGAEVCEAQAAAVACAMDTSELDTESSLFAHDDRPPSDEDTKAVQPQDETSVKTEGDTTMGEFPSSIEGGVADVKPGIKPDNGPGGEPDNCPDDKMDVKPDVKSDVKPDVKPRQERLLVLVGTYSIGKERIVKAIAQALSTSIFCDARKRELFLAQDDPDLHALLTEDPLEAQVHVGWLRDINREVMSDYLAKWKAPRVEGGFTKMIGLRPTGWTYRSETKDKVPSIPKILQLEQQRKFSPAGLSYVTLPIEDPQRDSTPMCMAFGVPYSEHSSFFELTCFALSLDYVRIIPTVNVHTAGSRNKMKSWIDRWAAEKKRRADAKMPRIVPYRNLNYW